MLGTELFDETLLKSKMKASQTTADELIFVSVRFELLVLCFEDVDNKWYKLLIMPLKSERMINGIVLLFYEQIRVKVKKYNGKRMTSFRNKRCS